MCDSTRTESEVRRTVSPKRDVYKTKFQDLIKFSEAIRRVVRLFISNYKNVITELYVIVQKPNVFTIYDAELDYSIFVQCGNLSNLEKFRSLAIPL